MGSGSDTLTGREECLEYFITLNTGTVPLVATILPTVGFFEGKKTSTNTTYVKGWQCGAPDFTTKKIFLAIFQAPQIGQKTSEYYNSSAVF